MRITDWERKWAKLAAALAVLSTVLSQPALAQEFRAGEIETVFSRQPSGVMMMRAGKIGEYEYNYMYYQQGEILNGSVNGPLTDSRSDPDRWIIAAKKDEMSDEITWTLRQQTVGLTFVMTDSDMPGAVCIRGHDSPKKLFMVRVRKEEAFELGPSRCSTVGATEIFEQLKGGGNLRTRLYKWPDETATNREANADTFSAALSLLEFLMKYEQPE